MWTLGIDPGRECLGWALVGSGRPAGIGLSRVKTRNVAEAASHHVHELHNILRGAPGQGLRLVAEIPQIDGRQRRIDFAPVLDLALLTGLIVGNLQTCFPFEKVVLTPPREWKGSVPKEIHHRRILEGLAYDDRAFVLAKIATMPKGLRHNALDALGLALLPN